MSQTLACTTLLVHDYDTAIDFFTRALRFALLQDTVLPDGKRWILVGPACGEGGKLLLAQASTPEQQRCVGQQAGGRVFQFLHTRDFAADHAHMLGQGVVFAESPRVEPYGTVAVFLDVVGNKWDLLQPAAT